MTLTPDQQTIQRRQFALALAECPGWREWALPAMLNNIQSLSSAVLENDTLEGSDLLKVRAQAKILRGFLSDLHTIAKGAFETPTPSAPGAFNLGVDELRERVLSAFSIPAHTVALMPPRLDAPPENDITSFSPFAGIPQPAPKKTTQP